MPSPVPDEAGIADRQPAHVAPCSGRVRIVDAHQDAGQTAIDTAEMPSHPERAMKPLFVLVADASEARLLASNGPQKALREIRHFSHSDSRLPGKAYARERPGRTHERMGPLRHAVEEPSDPRDQEAERFAHALAEAVTRLRDSEHIERLAVFAPPRFLGHLRARLSPSLQRLVVFEGNKDFTRIPVHALADHLPDALWRA
jgi:protein required for attachment to host cells